MSVIQGRCPRCGEVELEPGATSLVAPTADSDRYLLDFRCPTCARRFRSAVAQPVARALQRAGVHLRRPEAEHPERPPSGPALTHDDLLDLHLLLASEDWFDELLLLDRA